MSEWSPSESDREWSREEAETESSTAKWANGSRNVFAAGRRFLSTLRWAVATLRTSPSLIAVALIASGVPLFATSGEWIRVTASMLGVVLVTDLAVVLGKDAIEDSNSDRVTQLKTVLGALPGLLVTVLGYGIWFFIGTFLPSRLLGTPGLVFGLLFGTYLGGLLLMTVPSYILDQSHNRGYHAFSRSNPLALGFVILFAGGQAPVMVLSPTVSEPLLAAGLASWAGVVTAITGLAFTRLYLACRFDSTAQTDGPKSRKDDTEPAAALATRQSYTANVQ